MLLQQLDLLLRGAALGLTVLAAVLSLQLRHAVPKWLTFTLAASVGAFVLNGSSVAHEWTSWSRVPLQLFAVAGVYAFWGLSRYLFEDRFEIRTWHLLLVAAMLGSVVSQALLRDDDPLLGRLIFRAGVFAPMLVLLGHLLWRVVRDRRHDLVDSRVRARWIFVATGAALALATVMIRSVLDADDRAVGDVVTAAAYVALQLLLLSLFTELRWPNAAAPGPTKAERSDATDATAKLVSRVQDAMRNERLYLTSGLTISDLSQRLDIPEYRLRRVVHEGLGHRNFNDFLNEWRLRDAAQRLLDPTRQALPILTIALDVGYGSIGPFNRAFKARFNMTPSEYRRSGASLQQNIAES